jgi:hypothetical protein
MNKPIIVFYEPYEIMIKETNKMLNETNMIEKELLEKYDIDYDSFFHSNIRDEKGFILPYVMYFINMIYLI